MILGYVTVVVPTRNRSALLPMTLRSVLAQRDVDLEVIVVDGASTDDTPTVLAALADTRLRVVWQDAPDGVSSARNRGAAEARGEWLAFVDDDDLWAPDKLARQLHAAATAGRDWAYTGAVTITADGQIVEGRPPLPPERVVAALARYNAIPAGGSNVVVRRTAWQQAGQFDARLRSSEDWEMWIRLAKHGSPACVPHPLVAYRVHASNAGLDVFEVVRGAKLIEALHQMTLDWGLLHRWMAESCLRRGQRGAAVRHFMTAATRGQLRGAASDVAAILRRRIARHLHNVDDESGSSRDPWIAEAAQWLNELGNDNQGEPIVQPAPAADWRPALNGTKSGQRAHRAGTRET